MERPPDRPGVYFLVEPDGELRYIGKATSLRSRLGGAHARWEGRRVHRRCFWEVASERGGGRGTESDLIVFLKPLGNRSHVAQDPDVFIRLPPCEGEYGTFPHLAKGAHTSVAKRMKAGFAALERIVADGEVDPRALHDLAVRPQRSGPRRRTAGARPDPRPSPASETSSRPATSTDSAPDASEPSGSGMASRPDRCPRRRSGAASSRRSSELIGDFHVPEPDDLATVVGRRRAASMRRGTR